MAKLNGRYFLFAPILPPLGNPKKKLSKGRMHMLTMFFWAFHDGNFRNCIVFSFFAASSCPTVSKRGVDNAIICQNTVVKRLHVWTLCRVSLNVPIGRKNTAQGFSRNNGQEGGLETLEAALCGPNPTACDHLQSRLVVSKTMPPVLPRKSKKFGTHFFPMPKWWGQMEPFTFWWTWHRRSSVG